MTDIHDIWGFAHDNGPLYPEGYDKNSFAFVADGLGNEKQIAHVKFWTEKYLQQNQPLDDRHFLKPLR